MNRRKFLKNMFSVAILATVPVTVLTKFFDKTVDTISINGITINYGNKSLIIDGAATGTFGNPINNLKDAVALVKSHNIKNFPIQKDNNVYILSDWDYEFKNIVVEGELCKNVPTIFYGKGAISI